MKENKAIAYISSDSQVLTDSINTVCLSLGIQTVIKDSNANHLAEIKSCNADMVFIQASIVERFADIIPDIRRSQKNKHCLIIIHGTRIEVADFAKEKGADSFLPIPFRIEQVESILRLSIDLPKKVLIFSKQAKNIKELKSTLENEQFTIINTFSSLSALEITKRAFPDIVIIDSSTNSEASQYINSIKNTGELFHIPIIYLSESNEAEAIENSFQIGADEVLVPPYNSKENINTVLDIVSPGRGLGNTVLVVDDSNVMRDYISRSLIKNGYKVITAQNGKEGIEKAIEFSPNLITSDYDMPEMNGWEMCAELRKKTETKDTPIIMITSRDNDLDQRKTKAIGINNYIVKPFEESQLITAVKIEQKKHKKFMEDQALSKYISKDTITNIEKNLNQNREPEEKFLTILFTDIVGFTPMCESLTSYEVVKVLNDYFEEMVDILHKYDAIIDKFIGDAIMARFDSGDPKQDAINAVTAGIKMIDRLKEINKEKEIPVKIRIGINSGNVIIGNIGCQKYRLDYTIIGDNVNTAQRLESAAPHMNTLISQSTYDMTKEIVNIIEEKELSLKGKSKKTVGYIIELKQ